MMILRQIELKRFGKFDERSFEFRRGLNVVVGPNEAGKSTIMEAIPAVLFGLRDKDRFKKWGRSAECEAALVFEGGGRTIRIERNILSDRVHYRETDDLYQTVYEFEGKVSPLGRSSDRSEYFSRLSEFLGVVENDLFRASVFFGQGNLEVSGKGGLSEKIKALISGYLEIDYDKVLASLEDDYFKITRGNPWGKDKTRDREYEEVCSRLQEAELHKESLYETLDELNLLRDKISELTKTIEFDKMEATRGQKYLVWVRRQWHLEEQQNKLNAEFSRLTLQLDKVEALQAKQKLLKASLDKQVIPAHLIDELPGLLKESGETRQRLIQMQEEGTALRQELLEQGLPSQKGSIALTAAFLIPGLFVAFLVPSYSAYALLISILLISMTWAVHVWRNGDVGAHMGGLKGQLRVVELGREQAQLRLAEIDQILEDAGLSPSAAQKELIQGQLNEYKRIRGELNEVAAALEVLDDPVSLKSGRDTIVRELAVLEKRLEQERPMRGDNLLSLEDLPEAEHKLEVLQESLRSNEQNLAELTAHEMTISAKLESLSRTENECAQLAERKRALEHRKKVLATALEVLSSAVDEFRRTYLDRFVSDVSKYLGTVSSGIYLEVACSEDFDFSLKTAAQGWKPLECFSQGTRDAVSLAVRLALSRHLARGRNLPLFLDDPLVNLDRFRFAETMKTLDRLSADHQIVFFTHDEGILKRATRDRWHCISLDEIRTEKNQRIPERSEDVSQLCLL